MGNMCGLDNRQTLEIRHDAPIASKPYRKRNFNANAILNSGGDPKKPTQ